MDIELNYKEQLEQILNNDRFQEIEILKRGFVITKEIKDNSLLFIGINPSFNEKHKNKIKNKIIEFDDNETIKHKYFNKFKDISTKTSLNWNHLDLLFYRKTNQKHFHELVRTQIGKEFTIEQLKISKDILDKSNAKIIIVNNTLARDLIQGKFNLDFTFNYRIEFDEKIGTHRLNKNGTPIFFTSMLTGQRALDLGSLDRLIWHIKFVLNELNKK